MQSTFDTAYRLLARTALWLKIVSALALCPATLVVVQHASPAPWSLAELTHLASHLLENHTPHNEPILALQTTHLVRIATAILAGFVVGISAAAWQTLRRSPAACIQMTGLPLAASLGAMMGHLAVHKTSWPAALGPALRGLPFLTGALGAFAMACAFAVAAHRRSRQALGLHTTAVNQSVRRLTAVTIFLLGMLGVSFCYRISHTHPGGMSFWIVGSFAHGHAASWLPALGCIAFGVAILSYVSGAMAQLLPGDAWARQSGINIASTKMLACIGVCMLLAAAVNLSGHILGVGLVAVSLARLCVGDMPRLLWPTAGVLGAIAALWVDALAQASGDVQELPVGLFCAALAAFGLWNNGTTPAKARI